MKKITLLLTAVFCLISFAYAQNYYFGLKSGFKKESFSTSSYSSYQKNINFLTPTIFASYKLMFPNNMEIGWGFGYYSYSQNIKLQTIDKSANTVFLKTGNYVIYRAAYFNFLVGYNLKIIGDFCFKFSTGFDCAVYFNNSNSFYYESDAEGNPSLRVSDLYLNSPLNILITNSVGYQYFTKRNFGVGLFIAYHAGLFDVYRNTVTNTFNTKNYSYSLSNCFITRGSYIEAGIELGYRLQKKED